METRANYVLTGGFVLLAAIALMLFTVWISREPYDRDFKTFDVVFEGAVNGLSDGGEVRFNGIKVGEVKDLHLDATNPNRVIARIRVAAETPVRTDSVAQLDFLGITGVTFIQLRAGSSDKPLLRGQNGAPAQIMAERTALDELFSGGQDVLSITTESLNRINGLLTPQNVESLSAILANLDEATGRAAGKGGAMDNANSAMISIERAASAIELAALSVDEAAKGVTQLTQDVRPGVSELEPMMAEAHAAITDLRIVSEALRVDIAPMASQVLEGFGLASADVSATLLKLQALVDNIDRDPSQFVVKSPLPVE